MTDVSFGSNSEVRAGDREVGFAPMSGHSYERQLCAKSGRSGLLRRAGT
jgi:hypothetical protein